MEEEHKPNHSLESTLYKAIQQIWATEVVETQTTTAVDLSPSVVQEIITPGDTAYNELIEANASASDFSQLPAYVRTFIWSDRAKDWLILWRDIIFQNLKAQLLLSDGKIDAAALSNLSEQSKAKLLEATQYFEVCQDREVAILTRNETRTKKYIDARILEENPWPLYKKQFEEIAEQSQKLQAQFGMLNDVSEKLKTTEQLVQKMLSTYLDTIQKNKGIAEAGITGIQNLMEEEKPGKVVVYLEGLENQVKPLKKLAQFAIELEKEIKTYPEKEQVPVDTNNGTILYKEINFQRNVKSWVDTEIMPLLYEVREICENSNNAVKMAIINIRNRSILINNETKEDLPMMTVNKDELTQPLTTFLKNTEERQQALFDLSKKIDDRLNEAFFISAVFDKRNVFLPIPLQSTINQLRSNQSELFVRFKNWTDRQVQRVKRFQNSVEKEESLSTSEKIVRFVQSRNVDPLTSQYTSIFLTKGYIGGSFWVGRSIELARVDSLIDQWRNGFRGAVILSGQRLCGKSMFGDYVAERQFKGLVIVLKPNSTIEVNGRPFTTTYNLGEALEFIAKHSLRDRPLIWIDDLELWVNMDITLNQNVTGLCKAVDSYSGRMFFMVSVSTWLKAKLDKTNDLDKIFQAEINLDRMKAEDVRQAILTRHGATHKVLVNDDDKEITAGQFNSLTKRVYNLAEGNIGEALYQWVFSIHKIDEDKVDFNKKSPYHLPDFINADTGMLLTSLALAKVTNERRLAKIYGTPFQTKYRGILQRLISVGLLKRSMNGGLEINEMTANEVVQQLGEKNYLKFYH